MTDKDFDEKFPYPIAFIVTGLSCFAFRYGMQLLNTSLPSAFYWIGIAAVSLGCISGLIKLLFQKEKESSLE
jgi:hypothetical protein